MKKTMIALYLTCCLVVPTAFARAGDRDADFDQGVDASAILQKARGYATKRLAPMAPVKLKLRGVKRKKTAVALGQYPPVSPLILNSAIYPVGVNLRADPKYFKLPAEVLDPFEVDWAKINGTRSDLLSQASSWEGRNDQLYSDGLQLDRDKETLDRRVGDFNAEVGRYNQACTTRPLPPDEYQRCVAWRDSLNGRKAQLENDIRNHNARVNSWNQRSQAIFDQRGTMVVNIRNWETWIQNWAELVRKALAASCRPVEKIESRPAGDSVFTGGFSANFEVRAFFKTEPADAPPCPVEYLWSMQVHPPIPPGPFGTLSPLKGPKTVFTSGNYAGIGTIVVQELNSGKGTGSTINVVNPSR